MRACPDDFRGVSVHYGKPGLLAAQTRVRARWAAVGQNISRILQALTVAHTWHSGITAAANWSD
jgi:hypothetical protein